MSSQLFVLAPLMLVALLVALGLAAAGLRGRGVGLPSDQARAAAHQRRVDLVAALVLVLVWVLVVLLAGSSAGAAAIGALPAVSTALAAVVLLVGERTWPRPVSDIRHALLDDRSLRTALDHGWARAYAVALAVSAVLLPLLALASDDGQVSRTITRVVDGQAQVVGGTAAGPYPGWAVVLTQLVALALLAAVVVACAHAAVGRSALPGAGLATDHALRRATTARAARFGLAATLLTVGGDLVFGGSAVSRVWQHGWQPTAGHAAVVVGLLLGLAALVLALLPSGVGGVLRAAAAERTREPVA